MSQNAECTTPRRASVCRLLYLSKNNTLQNCHSNNYSIVGAIASEVVESQGVGLSVAQQRHSCANLYSWKEGCCCGVNYLTHVAVQTALQKWREHSAAISCSPDHQTLALVAQRWCFDASNLTASAQVHMQCAAKSTLCVPEFAIEVCKNVHADNRASGEESAQRSTVLAFALK
jgi:hypothetical protein